MTSGQKAAAFELDVTLFCQYSIYLMCKLVTDSRQVCSQIVIDYLTTILISENDQISVSKLHKIFETYLIDSILLFHVPSTSLKTTQYCYKIYNLFLKMISCCFRIHRILYLSGINMSSWNGDCGLWTLFQMRYKSTIGYAVSQSQTNIFKNNLSHGINGYQISRSKY